MQWNTAILQCGKVLQIPEHIDLKQILEVVVMIYLQIFDQQLLDYIGFNLLEQVVLSRYIVI
jgi:hypothetical protein